jgi:hypothetical protein
VSGKPHAVCRKVSAPECGQADCPMADPFAAAQNDLRRVMPETKPLIPSTGSTILDRCRFIVVAPSKNAQSWLALAIEDRVDLDDSVTMHVVADCPSESATRAAAQLLSNADRPVWGDHNVYPMTYNITAVT